MTGAEPRASHAGPDRFMKRDLSAALKLVLRTYACTELCTFFALRLGEVIEGARAFNGCFLVEEHGWLHRVGGMDLHGDILIRHDTQADGFTVTIEHRAGDEGLVRELEQEMGKVLVARPNPPSPLKTRPPGMAYFFQMIQGQALGRKVIIADAVVEQAHLFHFAGYRVARQQLEVLGSLHERLANRTILSAFTTEEVREARLALRRHREPKACWFNGNRIWLWHQIEAREPKSGRVLTMHFARLPAGKVLVGWVEETPF